MDNNIELNWNKLKIAIVNHIDSPRNDKYLAMLDGLEKDRRVAIPTESEVLLLGFKRAPAAKRNHHAREGGLVEHLLEMWLLWCDISPAMPEVLAEHSMRPARVLEQIILHDLEKADGCFTLLSEDPWLVEYFRFRAARLLEGDVRSLSVAYRYGIQLSEIQLNALFWSHGGFSKAPPKACCVLAKMIYLLDEMSGNVLEPLRRNDPLNLLAAS